MTVGQQSYGQEDYLDELSDLETISHMYGLVTAVQEEKVEEQLETVYDQAAEFRRAKMPGSRESRVEEGLKLWTEVCNYWSMTGMYDPDSLMAVTPVLAGSKTDIGVDVDRADSIEEVKEILDEGIQGF